MSSGFDIYLNISSGYNRGGLPDTLSSHVSPRRAPKESSSVPGVSRTSWQSLSFYQSVLRSRYFNGLDHQYLSLLSSRKP